jgi:hypothetical protein
MILIRKDFAVEVFPQQLKSGAFSAYASVRNFGRVRPGFLSSFIIDYDGQEYPTEDDALAAGLVCARAVVDELWLE